MNPGFCKTTLSRNAPPAFREKLAAQAKFARTPEDGSRTLLHGAFAGEDSHGKYLSSCAIAEYVKLHVETHYVMLTQLCFQGNGARVVQGR